MDMQKKYEKLKKKYRLPSFDDINNEFEISSIDNDDFLLREIRRKISEKIEAYTKFLEEQALQPSTDVANMYEFKVFDDEERREIFNIYKRLMFFSRFSIEAGLYENDEKTAEFIKSVLDEWKEIKKKIMKFIVKVKKSWMEEKDIKEDLGYMG
ncbi:hypothetical protein GF361_01835 [Candidatus Woesearchaeota archaeon]|nr:hypothetical protein [Candidatus Woesearchaeota archaeon]